MKRLLIVAVLGLLLLGGAALADIQPGYDPADDGDRLRFGDGNELIFGGVASFRWEDADANANYLLLELPAGGAVDVPVFAIGIAVDDVDLGLFNGVTRAWMGVVDADKDSAVGFSFSADDVATISLKGSATLTLGTVTIQTLTANALTGYVIGTDIQAYDADLAYLAGFTPTANVKTILNAADFAAIRTALTLVPGTDVQAYDADLTTYAGITPSANIQSLLAVADYAAARTALGLAIGTNVQAYDADLTTFAGITPSANVQTLLGAADFAAMRTSLSLVVGANVQAWDADLDTYAGITPSANVQSLLAAADFAAMRTALALTVGTDVQAWDAGLANLAGITMAADQFYYASADNVHQTASVTAYARTILDDANAASVITTLGLDDGITILDTTPDTPAAPASGVLLYWNGTNLVAENAGGQTVSLTAW